MRTFKAENGNTLTAIDDTQADAMIKGGLKEVLGDDSTPDPFDLMKKPELVDWLEANEVEYSPKWGEKRLREVARVWMAAQLVLPDKESDEE